MRLIGMMDSPYVRRVAISLKLMGLPFVHQQISVFRHYEAFAAINPVVKAPSLVTDDEVVLLDSTLILEYLERLVPAGRQLNPSDPREHLRAQRILGLALAACEKAVQIYYENTLRPADKRHMPWLERVKGQLKQAYGLLETEVAGTDGWLVGERPLQADITTAVAWRFTNFVLPEMLATSDYPGIARLSAQAEALPEFVACPLT
jgi:glutathione S-transferase